MQATEIALIQTSFAEVKPISERAAALLYGRLFEIAPAVRLLFKGDMAEQGRKLMATLCNVVNRLADLPSVLPAASVLAKVTRDRLMRDYDAQFPGYGFASHKGYPTPQHYAAIEKLGGKAPVMVLRLRQQRDRPRHRPVHS